MHDTDIANSGIPVKVGMGLKAYKTVAMFICYVHTEDDLVRKATELVSNRRIATLRRGNGNMTPQPLVGRLVNSPVGVWRILRRVLPALIVVSLKRQFGHGATALPP